MSKSKNWYFDNDGITEAIKEYQRKIKEEGVKDSTIFDPYVSQIQTLIQIIINSYKIYRFYEDYKELEQEAMLAVLESFARFDPERGTVFNYMSFVVKNHLKAWTKNLNKKRWVTREYDPQKDGDELVEPQEYSVFDDLVYHAEANYDSYTAALVKETVNLIFEHEPKSKEDLINLLKSRQYKYSMIQRVMKVLEESLGTLLDE